jgi:hypothetical protein
MRRPASAWLLTLSLLIAPSAFAEEPQSQVPTDDATLGSYVCPMHPQVYTPAKRCPVCGMRLEPVYKEDGRTVGLGAHKDHEARHGGLLTMTGDHHLEFVDRGQEVRVYMYDAFTQPVPATGLSGKLFYRSDAERGTEEFKGPLELVPDASGEYLAAQVPADTVLWEVSAVIPLEKQELQVNCPLRMTLEGWIVDMACYLAHGPDVLEQLDCTKAGLAAGLPPALLVGTKEAPMVYLLTESAAGSSRPANGALSELAGRRVEVTGRLLKRRRMQMLELLSVAPSARAVEFR